MPEPRTPKLTKLAWGSPYCELCSKELTPGEPVAWWPLNDRKTVYCATCHAAKAADHYPQRECSTCHFLTEPGAYRGKLTKSSG